MRTKIISYNDKEALMIYTDKQERYTPQFQEYIAKSKKHYGEVVIFVSGDGSLENVFCSLIYDSYNDTSS